MKITPQDLQELEQGTLETLLADVHAEIERRRTIRTARETLEHVTQQYVQAVAAAPDIDLTGGALPADGIGPGRIVVQDGRRYRNITGRFLGEGETPDRNPGFYWDMGRPVAADPMDVDASQAVTGDETPSVDVDAEPDVDVPTADEQAPETPDTPAATGQPAATIPDGTATGAPATGYPTPGAKATP